MKYFLFLFLFFPYLLFSQDAGKIDDLGRISLNVLLPDDSKIPEESRVYFINKLNQVVAINGMGNADISDPRFILTGSINELNNEQLSESVLNYFNLEIVILVIDLKENKIFNSTSLNLKGIGNTKSKAYADCIKRIDPKNKQIIDFLEISKMKILNFYNTQCDFIQSRAKNFAKQNKYDEAIYNLSLVPDISESCYAISMSNLLEIYTAKINFECRQTIDKAKLLVSLNQFDEAASMLSFILPNTDCYKESLNILKEIKDQRCSFLLGKAKAAWSTYNIEEASEYLSEISADSKCNTESTKLINEIKKYSIQKDNREWNLKLKIQNDDVEIRKAAINAAKEIGVSFGKSQPKTIVNHNFKTFW